MSKSAAKKKAKALKKEKAVIKARQKAFIIAGIFALVVVAAAAVGINVRKNNNGASREELYTYGGQTVQLLTNGTFTASLAHNVRKNGTYTKFKENGRTMITFIENDSGEVGWIINDELHLPREWEDGHGHGNIFLKAKNEN